MRDAQNGPHGRRPRHAWLYALPGGALPAAVECQGQRFEHVQTFKHDFFAATGLYRGPDGLAVLKLGRTTDFLSLPMVWLGRAITRHELTLYGLVQDLELVPRLIGGVGRTGLLHAFVPGHPLGRREAVSDTFFDELLTLVRTLHTRHIAYVDLNKRQNILVGEDGRPYLIDFQISLHLPPTGWRRLRPVRWLLSRFQQADIYHCLKHKRRLRPDLLTAEERARLERLSVWIRLHRWISRPLTYLRRRTLKRLARSEDVVVSGSSAK
ncbi:MAG: hypothetical protein PVJ57_04090 [Phycisphaerae bacterium]|jgi:hypothetical protein